MSWNGGGFDLPVLNHRALIHGVAAARFWDWGDDDREFRYNNYLSRYHARHLDLMDVLAMYQPRAMRASTRWRALRVPGQARHGRQRGRGRVTEASSRTARLLRSDVMNTYLVYQRFQMMRGELSAGEYAKEISVAREKVAVSQAPHWKAFHAAWVG